MKLKYAGKYDGDPASLPHGEHMPGAVKFKEMENTALFSVVINIAACVVAIPLMIFVVLYGEESLFSLPLGAVLALVALIPHELLHAVCFKDEVYLYNHLRRGMMFVVGTEIMSKKRFILMSLLPNLLLGALPFIVFCVFPQLMVFGVFGALNIAMGAGDYYNVINAAVQMPKRAKTYLYQFNSYWYLPEKERG